MWESICQRVLPLMELSKPLYEMIIMLHIFLVRTKSILACLNRLCQNPKVIRQWLGSHIWGRWRQVHMTHEWGLIWLTFKILISKLVRLRWKLRFQEKEEDWLRIAQMLGFLIVTFQEYLLFILFIYLIRNKLCTKCR